MNVPFTAVHFSAYETAKRLLSTSDDEGLVIQLVAGGAAGGLSAACTNPLDVLKTRLQTDGMLKHRRAHSPTAMVRCSCVARKASTLTLSRGALLRCRHAAMLAVRHHHTLPASATLDVLLSHRAQSEFIWFCCA